MRKPITVERLIAAAESCGAVFAEVEVMRRDA
jgi:hypothetical protein